MTPASTCNPDLLHLMTSARREHDRALGDFIHRIWQALTDVLTPPPAPGAAHCAPQAPTLHPGP